MLLLEPITNEEFPAFIARLKEEYASEMARALDLTHEQAMAQSEATLQRLLPGDGPDVPDQFLFVARDGAGQRVGTVWLGIRRDRREPYAYVWDLFVEPAHRGKGAGETIMRCVEERARALGLGRIALNVFGHNLAARRLYERLGYTPASLAMEKFI